MTASATRALTRSLMFVPLVLIVHVGAAAAGEISTVPAAANAHDSAGARRVSGDAQEAARQLLLGVTSHAPTLPTPGVSIAPAAPRSVGTTRVRGDAQESARQLLLGAMTHTAAVPSPEVSRANGNRRHGDAQLYAQQLLLGRRDVPEAGL